MSRREQFEKYMDITLRVRSLSSPFISNIDSDKGYRDTLLANFIYIGDYALEKKQILREDILPLLKSRRLLKKGEIEDLKYLYASLFNAYSMENLDLPLTYRLADRLLLDADKKGDKKDIIAALDAKVEIAFAYMHMIQRLSPVDPLCYYYRDEGLKAARRLLEYLPKRKFKALPDEASKHLVLINSRYISSLFDRSDCCSQRINRRDMKILERSLALTYDPFYTREAPGYDWHYHELRALQYIADMAQFDNVRKLDRETLEKIYDYTRRLETLWYGDEEYCAKYIPWQIMYMHVTRISALTGHISEKDYRDRLYQIMMSGEAKSFDIHENMINILAMGDYLTAFTEEDISPEEKERLNSLYDRIVAYVHRMPRKGSVSFMLSFLGDVLKKYKEYPGGEDFEEFCLKVLAALHPPTYVHSLCVAELARILTQSLLEQEPERFVGFHAYKSREEVSQNREDILRYAYHASLTHDIGKLFVAEVITTYDRDLFDEEFQMIRMHPLIGAYILSMHESTREYANIAKYHHLYFDGSQGYPREDISGLPEKVFIDIIGCVDCLDAATDWVGRSYKEGKTLQQFLLEMQKESGTQFAPYVVKLFEDPKVQDDVDEALFTGRNQNYQKTYSVLSG